MTNAAKAVVIGASAGALDALSAILPALPADFPYPIILVVHLPADRKSVLPELLQSKCGLKVREAEDKEELLAGHVYTAPPDYHLLVEKDYRLSLSNEEPVNFSRPSIDVLFETAADAYGERLTAVLLTGANSDGAVGLKAITDVGGMAIVQKPSLAYAPEMPQAGLKACPGALVLDLGDIAGELKKGIAA